MNKLHEFLQNTKKLMGLTEEVQKKSKYEYGCAMLYLNFDEMNELHRHIDKDDVYVNPEDPSFGLETEPHVTLLFGLHPEVTTEIVNNIVGDYTFSTVKAHNASLFENELFDVLKFDIEADSLHQCNSDLATLPHTSKFSYHPHMTVAYLKPGRGKKYVEVLQGKEYWLSPSHGIYSHPDGGKTKIPVRID
jgi:2'-5' RNA ligase